ncbi:MAG: magnesium transporter, partial [Armatimonadetes bacterium]|nr:magnesium transporter [Armatimonadota bacterium]
MSFALPIAPAVEVAEVLARGGPAGAALQLLALHPVEMAEALEPLEDDARVAIVAELPLHLAAQVLQNGDAAFRTGLLERLAPARLAQMLDRLPVEHAAQLLEQVDPDRQQEILAESPADDVAQMRAIRSCPPSSVGRLMLRQVPRVQAHMTVRETLAFLRATASEMETINDLYILDEDRVLQGVVSLRQLVLAVPDAPLRDVMQTRVVRVAPETDREEAANLLSRYNFLALPVADESGRLLGVVTVDDLMDVLIQEGTEDLLHLGAVSGGDDAAGETSYWAGRITSAVKKRLGWLMLLFVAGSFTSQVLSHFHHELQAVVALS